VETKTISIKTFGCRANSLDTDAMTLEAQKRGYQIVDETEVADTYVINSCTVTHAADAETRTLAMRLKKKNPAARVAVVGCYAQVAKDELQKLPTVDYILGTADKLRLFDLLESPYDALVAKTPSPASGFLPDEFPGSRNSRANIKIQDGCNFSCSYCIIPQARGRSRSLPLEKVISQVRAARDQGFEEVVLTGIHLAHYGWDKKTNLLTLVKAILDMENGPRLRLSTLDPFEIPDELIEMVGVHPKLCPYFHIALQSGSNSVLKGMRRIYRAEEFVKVTNRLRQQCPDVFIGVDVIVGFHGETEEAFAETVQCLKDSYWTKLHVFPFSLRRGTKAETLADPIPTLVKQARSKQLRDWSAQRHLEFMQSQLGRPLDVLIEKPSAKHPGFWQGHSANYLPILLEDSLDLPLQAKVTYGCTPERVENGLVFSSMMPRMRASSVC